MKSSEGGVAHVRITGGEFPRVTFQYVYVARPDAATMLKDLVAAAGEVKDEDKAAIRRSLAGLDKR